MESYTIQKRTSPRGEWKSTKHQYDADTANHALRQFGLRDAFTSERVKVAKGKRTGTQYRAVPTFTVTEAVTEVKSTGKVKDIGGDKKGVIQSGKVTPKRKRTVTAKKAETVKPKVKRTTKKSAPKLTAKEREAAKILAELDALTKRAAELVG